MEKMMRSGIKPLPLYILYLGYQVAVVGGGRKRGEAEGPLAGGEGGRRLDEGRSVAEGTEASLLGEELLVGHGIDGVREGEGRAASIKDFCIKENLSGKHKNLILIFTMNKLNFGLLCS